MKARGLALLACCACVGEQHHGFGAGIEAQAIDWSIDPCQDLYQFACGNWERWHDFYPDTAGRSRTIDQQGEIDVIYRLVTGAGDTGADATSTEAQTVHAYYRACQGSTLDQNRPPIDEELSAIGRIATVADLARALARLHEDGVSALFRLSVEADPGMPDLNVPHLRLAGWSLPDRTQYWEARAATVRAQYGAHVGALTRAFQQVVFGAPDANAVVKIETALAQGTPSKEEEALPESSYHPVDRSELLTTHFPWTIYLEAAGVGPFTSFNLDQPAALTTIESLVAGSSLADLRKYLVWRVLEAHGWAADWSSAAEEFHFHRQQLSGAVEEPGRYWECFLDAESWMAPLLARRYVQRRFGPEARAEAARLIEAVRTSLAARMRTRPWLDEPTRQAALDKLAQVEARVGYPDEWPPGDDYAYDDGQPFVANRIAIIRRLRARNLATLGTPVNRALFAMSPLTINAAYVPELNQIVFPAAILQPPFFASGRPAAVNLGAIGTVMGHELTHGFDDWGRHFDGHGGLRDWWTPTVAAEFDARAQCLVDEYSAFQISTGGHVDGAFTLGENIADLGGVLVAHDAWLSLDEPEDNDGWFTRSQQFFVAFAQSWCGRTRDRAAELDLLTDPHAPERFRVNGTVTNVPAFAEAFRCPAGAALAPATRCELW